MRHEAHEPEETRGAGDSPRAAQSRGADSTVSAAHSRDADAVDGTARAARPGRGRLEHGRSGRPERGPGAWRGLLARARGPVSRAARAGQPSARMERPASGAVRAARPGAAAGTARPGFRLRAATAVLAAVVAGAPAAGCTGSDDGREDETEAPAAGPVLAVKIDNVRPARPQTGIDKADVVYAEQVEGGLSRLMAVFATRLPESVGPVRSARESDLELLRQFDDPVLAFSGAQSRLLPLIDKAPVEEKTPGNAADAYFREPARAAPHNLFLRPNRLLDEPGGAGALTTGFRYGAAPTTGGTAKKSVTVGFPAARFTFTWDGGDERWLVGMDGSPTVTTDGVRVSAATVVVQHVKIRDSQFRDFLGNNTPYTETVGSGSAEVLRDGRSYEAEWDRPEAEDGTRFTTPDGDPLNFAEGPVWVVLARE